MKKTPYWPGLLMALSLSGAHAANQEIRALFQPDPSTPWKNQFINKTPNSGYCAIYPDQCAANNMFSIQVPIRYSTVTPLFANNGVWVTVPAEWRSLTVTHPETQQTSTVEVRISGIGSIFTLGRPATELAGEPDLLEAHRKLWRGSSWANPPAPCQVSGVGAYTPLTYRFFWKTPQKDSCNKIALFDIGHMSFGDLNIAYELRTPNPLTMASGLYTGSLTYTVGRGGSDFSMGPFFNPDDSSLTLDFVLDVQHTLKVDLPPGGNRIALEPDGGWQTWLNTRKPPRRLYRDQTFHISSSSRFKVYTECARKNPNYCYLFNEADNAEALLQVKVSLPAGLTDVSGNPVHGKELFPGVSSAVIFQPGRYIDRQQGTLHFEVPKEWTETILTSGKGNKYSGTIVVVFDSEL